MAYCRYSTDDFQCDLYVYSDNNGYTILVARYRVYYYEPLPPEVLTPLGSLNLDLLEAQVARMNKIQSMYEMADKQPIGLEADGESWFGIDRDHAVAVLQYLRDLGYRFPYNIIEEIAEEPDTPLPLKYYEGE